MTETYVRLLRDFKRAPKIWPGRQTDGQTDAGNLAFIFMGFLFLPVDFLPSPLVAKELGKKLGNSFLATYDGANN